LKLGPQTIEKQLTERKQFKLYLNPAVYRAFRIRCKLEKRKPNIVVECFMLTCLGNPRLIDVIEHLTYKSNKA